MNSQGQLYWDLTPSQTEYYIRKCVPSKKAGANQALKFCKNILRCSYRFISDGDEEVLIFYNRFIDNSDIIVGRGIVRNDKSRSEAGIDACLDCIQNLRDEEFLKKLIMHALVYMLFARQPDIY